MEEELERRRRDVPLTEPIPASRELAKHYGVVYTSVFRHLQRMADSGRLWKAENGRFYFSGAQSLVRKPRPIACLFRKIDTWSMLYQEFMEGISSGCEAEGIGSLLWHEDGLVRQSGPGVPPDFADTARQIPSLERFVSSYGEDVGGIILDHVWTDDAIGRAFAELRKPVVRLGRPGAKNLPALAPDYRFAARVALAQLSALGYRNVYPVRPFPNDPAIEFCLQSLLEVAASDGRATHVGPVQSLVSAEERTRLLDLLAKRSTRAALIFPEDNSADLFWKACVKRGVACPEKIGILSLQGTRAAAQNELSHVRTDYVELGRLAVRRCLETAAAVPISPPHFVPGASTTAG